MSRSQRVSRGFAPAPAVWGFLLLLGLVFAASYAVGAAAGPMTPGVHHTGGGTSGTGDMGGMSGMSGMGTR
jgi:hypothetical protein